MKTTCLGILLWALLLPAIAIKSLLSCCPVQVKVCKFADYPQCTDAAKSGRNDFQATHGGNCQVAQNSEDVPQQSRIKREVILADEIYVDDLDQAATDSLGEIVVKRVLHSPIARSSYYPYGKKMVYAYDGEDELGDDTAQNTPGDEAEDGETSARSSATRNVRRNSASAKRIQNSGQSRVYDETEEPVTYYKDGARVYVVQQDTSSANARTNELTTSGRSSTKKQASKQQQRSIRTTKEATPLTSQRRSQPNAAMSQEAVLMECMPTDDGGKICILQNEKASSTAANNRRGSVRLSRNNGASELNRRSTLRRTMASDDNDVAPEDNRRFRSSVTQRSGQTVMSSESDEDDVENTGAEDEADEAEESEDGEDQTETQAEDEENPVEANNGPASGTYTNNIAFYCNCGYSGNQSQIASHVCQNASNSSNVPASASNSSSIGTDTAAGETPSTQYKKMVIIKYSGKPSKRSIRSDASAQNVADVDQEDEEETGTNGRRVRQETSNPSRRVVYVIQRTGAQETSSRGDETVQTENNLGEDEEEPESQTGTNGRRVGQGNSNSSRRVVYVIQRTGAQETSSRGDETVQTENNLGEDDPQTFYRIVPVRKTMAGGKCPCGVKQKANTRRGVIFVQAPEGADVPNGTSNEKVARYVLVKERQVEQEGEEEQEQTVEEEDNQEEQTSAADQYDVSEGEEGEEINSDQKVVYIKKMSPSQTMSGQRSAKTYYVQKPTNKYSDYAYDDDGEGEDDGACPCVRTARETQVEENGASGTAAVNKLRPTAS